MELESDDDDIAGLKKHPHTALPGRTKIDDEGREPGLPGEETRRLSPASPYQTVDSQQFDAKMALPDPVTVFHSIRSTNKSNSFQAVYSVLTAVAMLGGVAFSIFLAAQLTQIFVLVAQLPDPTRSIAYIFLGVGLVAALYPLVSLIISVSRLRNNRQVELRKLQERCGARIIKELQGPAKQYLREFVRSYPFDEAAQAALLESCGMDEVQQFKFREIAAELVSDDGQIAWDTWLADFENRFLAALDRAALQRIKDVSQEIAVKTAISPNALADSVIVLIGGFGMLEGLCRIYNLRLGLFGMLRLAGLVFSNAFLAGKIEDMPVEDWLTNGVRRALSGFSATEVVATLTGGLGGPAVQAVGNGLFLYRLGRHAARLLRPVR